MADRVNASQGVAAGKRPGGARNVWFWWGGKTTPWIEVSWWRLRFRPGSVTEGTTHRLRRGGDPATALGGPCGRPAYDGIKVNLPTIPLGTLISWVSCGPGQAADALFVIAANEGVSTKSPSPVNAASRYAPRGGHHSSWTTPRANDVEAPWHCDALGYASYRFYLPSGLIGLLSQALYYRRRQANDTNPGRDTSE